MPKRKKKTNSKVVNKKDLQKNVNFKKIKNYFALFFKKFSWQKLFVVLIVFYFVFVLLGAYFIYGKKEVKGFSEFAAKIFPYPAAVSFKEGIWISYASFLKKYDATLKDYQNYRNSSVDESDEFKKHVKEEVLNSLIKEALIEKLAKKFNIEVKNSEVEEEYQERLSYYNNDESLLEQKLKEYRNMNLEEYKNSIRKEILREKVKEKVLNEDKVYSEARQKAEDILSRIRNGEDFGKLADELSDKINGTAKGGDIGYVYKNYTDDPVSKNPSSKSERIMFYLPDAHNTIFALKVGEVSDVVRTDYGYHIFKVLERDSDKVRVAQIWIKTPNFEQWLFQKIEEAQFKKLIL